MTHDVHTPSLLHAPPMRQGMPLPNVPTLPNPEELGITTSFCKEIIPNEAACFALWDTYAMLPNIREHSKAVAHIAECLALQAMKQQELEHDISAVTRAAGLLHDIAKSYTLRYGGSHPQIGASWVMHHTGHRGIAQATLTHIEWPWPYPSNINHPALFVLYADKRVKHDTVVTLTERYEDLLMRYGRNEAAIASIRHGWQRALELERTFEAQFGINIHECSFD